MVRCNEVQPQPGRCCSASSCRTPGSDANTSNMADESTKSCHWLILNMLKHESSAAEEILRPPPGRQGIRCPKDEKEIFHQALEQWRTDHWQAIRTMAPMLSRDWVLGEHNTKKLVENTRLVINTPADKIDRRWVRALVDTVSDDAALDSLSSMIRGFRSGFFTRLNQPKPRPRKRQKVWTRPLPEPQLVFPRNHNQSMPEASSSNV